MEEPHRNSWRDLGTACGPLRDAVDDDLLPSDPFVAPALAFETACITVAGADRAV
jgi:hypothetical protein